jgi:hypothetical protein
MSVAKAMPLKRQRSRADRAARFEMFNGPNRVFDEERRMFLPAVASTPADAGRMCIKGYESCVISAG